MLKNTKLEYEQFKIMLAENLDGLKLLDSIFLSARFNLIDLSLFCIGFWLLIARASYVNGQPPPTSLGIPLIQYSSRPNRLLACWLAEMNADHFPKFSICALSICYVPKRRAKCYKTRYLFWYYKQRREPVDQKTSRLSFPISTSP